MELGKKEIIIRLIKQVYNYADEIIHLKSKIKELETDLENESIKFAEWLARNHYVLCNETITGIHYWENENSNGTTNELYIIFNKENNKELLHKVKIKKPT